MSAGRCRGGTVDGVTAAAAAAAGVVSIVYESVADAVCFFSGGVVGFPHGEAYVLPPCLSLSNSCVGLACTLQGYMDMAGLLIEHGASITSTDQYGKDARDYAAAAGYVNLAMVCVALCAPRAPSRRCALPVQRCARGDSRAGAVSAHDLPLLPPPLPRGK